ncbi:hypothetical protein PENSPDRAFT_661424 [Peniophora sp. CONT]|nr:hypothetical protein PENSPDRAFT_661424 [Peniophora sp. CONT]
MSYFMLVRARADHRTDSNGKRIVDDYPKDAISIQNVHHDMEAEPWRAIPNDCDLTAWMRMVPGTRRSLNVREHRVFYDDKVRPPPKPNAPWTVTVIVYGFIDNMNLSVTGSWDLTEENASKAYQWVKLGGGPKPSIFQAQADALSGLEQHIIGTLRGGGLGVDTYDTMLAARRKGLYLNRRVFDKVTPTTADSIPITGPAVKLVNKWRVTSTAKLGFRRDDLQLQSCTSAKFAPGDFVQAQVRFVVVAKDVNQYEPPRVFVNLDLLSLVRLVTARDIPSVMPAESQLVATKSLTEETVLEESVDLEYENKCFIKVQAETSLIKAGVNRVNANRSRRVDIIQRLSASQHRHRLLRREGLYRHQNAPRLRAWVTDAGQGKPSPARALKGRCARKRRRRSYASTPVARSSMPIPLDDTVGQTVDVCSSPVTATAPFPAPQSLAGRLAVEILVKIFRDVAAQDVPVDAPGLRRAPTALRLSRNIPLVYELSADMPQIPMEFNVHSSCDGDEEFALLTPLDRCRYVRVADGRGDVVEHIARLACLSADKRLSHLEELELNTPSYTWEGDKATTLVRGLGDAFTIYCDKLRLARFVNCYTTIDSPALEAYTLIFDTYFALRPSIEFLYKGLQTMAGNSLTHLTLYNATDDVNLVSALPPNTPRLHFPKLQRLRVHGYTKQVADILRTLTWPSRGTVIHAHVTTGDGRAQSIAEQMLILRLLYPRNASWRILRVEHLESSPLWDVTVVATWRTRPPRDPNVPDTQVVFEGGTDSCAWWRTVMTALPLMGETGVQVLHARLTEDDFCEQDIPWASILSSMTGLRAMHPWHQIMGSVGPVQDDSVLGTQFRERVAGLTCEHM